MSLSISDICILFARKGGRAYDGEPVTQLEHALQSPCFLSDAPASYLSLISKRDWSHS